MKPFVILTMLRSGSYYLVDLLNQHPDIVCNGEPLSTNELTGWRLSQPQTAFVGFKLMDRHIAEQPVFLDMVRACPEMHYVVLERNNQFETLRSLNQVWITNQWSDWEGEGEQLLPVIYLDPQQCRDQFAQAEQFYRACREGLPSERTLWLSYEDLCDDQDAALESAWRFFGLPSTAPLVSSFRRQESRPLAETVSNYAQLREVFADTPYAMFLPNNQEEAMTDPKTPESEPVEDPADEDSPLSPIARSSDLSRGPISGADIQ